MIEFVIEQLELLPFLFITYLVLEWIEAHAGGALERFLERARSIGPLVGGLAGAFPQCGFSVAAASLYSGGVITVGTLLSVFLSTSDELVPILIGSQAPAPFIARLVALKAGFAILTGFLVNAFIILFRGRNVPVPRIDELCRHSHCSCSEHRGVIVPALIHTAEIFAFIFVISALVELSVHHFGGEALASLGLARPVVGEIVGAVLGLIPNCAVSAAAADLYVRHPEAISAGALMASSFSGCGLGLLVLFRTNRNLWLNLLVLLSVLTLGALLGWLTGFLLQ